jgi:hypothetical protein
MNPLKQPPGKSFIDPAKKCRYEVCPLDADRRCYGWLLPTGVAPTAQGRLGFKTGHYSLFLLILEKRILGVFRGVPHTHEKLLVYKNHREVFT